MNHPGVYIPPPIFFITTFVAAVFIQRWLPINWGFFDSKLANAIGVFILFIGFLFVIPALYRFAKSKNTVITVKPANTLQTSGIYAISRNPMYVSLLLLYLGFTCIIGNWWNIILAPILVLVVQEYIIKREERYLDQRFGQAFKNYKLRVRRWI